MQTYPERLTHSERDAMGEQEFEDMRRRQRDVFGIVYADDGSEIRARDVLGLCIAVREMVGDDGTGNLGVIVEQAIADDPNVTATEIARIVREARDEWAVERTR